MKLRVRILFLLCVVLSALSCSLGVPTALPRDGGSIETKTGVEMYWESEDFPLQVLVNEEADPITYLAVVLAAARWNEVIDREVFTVAPHDFSTPAPRTCSFIAIEQHDIQRVDQVSETWDAFHRGYSRPHSTRYCSGYIAMDDEPTEGWLTLIFVHELGHALGLDHDGEISSIMYPTVRGSRFEKVIQQEDVLRVQAMVDGRFVPRRPPWAPDSDFRFRVITPQNDYRAFRISFPVQFN